MMAVLMRSVSGESTRGCCSPWLSCSFTCTSSGINMLMKKYPQRNFLLQRNAFPGEVSRDEDKLAPEVSSTHLSNISLLPWKSSVDDACNRTRTDRLTELVSIQAVFRSISPVTLVSFQDRGPQPDTSTGLGRSVKSTAIMLDDSAVTTLNPVARDRVLYMVGLFKTFNI